MWPVMFQPIFYPFQTLCLCFQHHKCAISNREKMASSCWISQHMTWLRKYSVGGLTFNTFKTPYIISTSRNQLHLISSFPLQFYIMKHFHASQLWNKSAFLLLSPAICQVRPHLSLWTQTHAPSFIWAVSSNKHCLTLIHWYTFLLLGAI